MRKTLAGTALALWLMACPIGVSAHATPTLYAPEASAILDSAPAEIQIIFSERPEHYASRILVFGPDGAAAHDGLAAVDESDARAMRVAVKNAGTGSYLVSWQIVSADDGHFTKGAYVFSVGGETPVAGATGAVEHRSSIAEAVTIATELLGQALLLGALAMIALRRVAAWSPDRERWFRRKLTTLVAVAVALVISGVIAYLIVRARDLQDPGTPLFPAVQTFLSTVAGRFAAYRAVAGLIFGVAFIAMRRSLFGGRISAFIVTGALLATMALLRARVSHAAASSALPFFAVLVNAVHLLGKNLWIGGIAAFGVVVLPLLRGLPARSVAVVWTTLNRMLLHAFLIGSVTGCFIVWLHLKSWDNLLITHWGMRFFGLAIFAMLFVLLRLYQQLIVTPRMTRADTWTTPKGRERLDMAWLMTGVEALTGVFVLFASSQLIITTPPLDGALPPAFGENGVSVGRHPYDISQMLVTAPAKTSAVVVSLTNEDAGIGPVVPETEKRFSGGYVFPLSQMTPPGTWAIDVSAQRPDAYDAVAHVTLRLPGDVAEPPAHGTGFLVVCLLAGLLLIAFCVVLGRGNRRDGRTSARMMESAPARISGWNVAVMTLAALPALAMLLYHAHPHLAFERTCTGDGMRWTDDRPTWAGRVTSPRVVMGCAMAVDGKRYHFADPREYGPFRMYHVSQ